MNSPMTRQIAWAFTVVNVAFFAGGVALAFKHDVKPLEMRANVKGAECTAAAETKPDCPAGMTWGRMFPLPADMLMSEPIAQF